MRRSSLLLVLCWLWACDDDPPTAPPLVCVQYDACGCDAPPCAAAAEPTLVGRTVTAPNDAFPAEVISQQAHNNLDLVEHDGRLFFAFRTAPSHFASDQTRLYVVSTEDQRTWRFEAAFHLQTDLREPRFLSVGGRLWLYFALLGTDPLAFQPGETRVTEYEGPGQWSTPAPHPGLPDGFIPWRVRVVDGAAWMMGYTNGEAVYSGFDEPVEVWFLRSADGVTWAPVAEEGVVMWGGVSEADFAFLDDGSLVVVGRNEAGEPDGTFGSRICRAEDRGRGAWRCADDPRKYDSPLVIRHGDAVWLIGRRHVTEDGHYDLGRDDLDHPQQWAVYQTQYWTKPKRCALWRVDPEALTVTHALDLPTAGDTCFASAVGVGGDAWLLYDYSSPPEEPNVSWRQGQTGPTHIYRTTLLLPPR